MTTSLAKGDRIELVEMPNDPDPIPVGATGTVIRITNGPYPQIHVSWDNGRILNLLPGIDKWRKI